MNREEMLEFLDEILEDLKANGSINIYDNVAGIALILKALFEEKNK